MDGKGCWRDNVFVERLWKSIKYEEVYCTPTKASPWQGPGSGATSVNGNPIFPSWGCGRELGLPSGVVHVFIRRSAPSREALYQAGQTSPSDHSSARLPDEERTQGLASEIRAA